MQIITIPPRGFGANTYAIKLDGGEAIVIDPAQTRVKTELEKLGVRAKYILLTHCHFDHIGGVELLQKEGARVYCSEKEKPLVGTYAELSEHFGAPYSNYSVDETFFDGEEKDLDGLRVQALLTSGHTVGSVCYLFTDKEGGRYLFTGDTLFAGTIGRTDFPTGSIEQMRASLRKISALQGDMPIYPGHEESTTLENERKTNPYMLDA